MREGFLLDPDVAYFNHGSYGACPVEVFADYQRWQLELERRPTEFLARRLDGAMYEARGVLAEFVGAHVDDLVFSTECDVCAQRGHPLPAHPARGGDPHDEARVRRDRADARVHPRERRARRARGADREHRDPNARDRRLPHHVADGARPSRRGDLRRGAEGRRSLHRRRRTRPGSHSARPRLARSRRVCGQLPQVAVRAEGRGVPVVQARAPGLDRARS